VIPLPRLSPGLFSVVSAAFDFASIITIGFAAKIFVFVTHQVTVCSGTENA
jgi:hypothetical protein